MQVWVGPGVPTACSGNCILNSLHNLACKSYQSILLLNFASEASEQVVLSAWQEVKGEHCGDGCYWVPELAASPARPGLGNIVQTSVFLPLRLKTPTYFQICERSRLKRNYGVTSLELVSKIQFRNLRNSFVLTLSTCIPVSIL